MKNASMRKDALHKTFQRLKLDRKGIAESMLIKLLLAGVFILIMLAVIVIMVNGGLGVTGEGNICERTGGFLRGCG